MLSQDLVRFNKRYLSLLIKIIAGDSLHAMNCYHMSDSVIDAFKCLNDVNKLEQFAEHSDKSLAVLYPSVEELKELKLVSRKPKTIEFASINADYLTLVRHYAYFDHSEAIIRFNLHTDILEFLMALSTEDIQTISRNAEYCLTSCLLTERHIRKIEEIHERLMSIYSMLALSDHVKLSA